jgi:hypothetical protein
VNERIVFVGGVDDGTQFLVEWYGSEPEVVFVSARPSPFARWGAPVECTKEES